MNARNTPSNTPRRALRSVMLHTDRGVSRAVTVMGWVAGAILAGIALFQTYAVTSRYFGSPILGSLDIIKYLMLVLVVLSIGYAEDQRAHVSVDILTSQLSARAQQVCRVIAILCTVFVAGLVAYVYFHAFISANTAANTSTGSISIPVKPFHFLIFVGFTAWAVSAATALLPRRRAVPSDTSSTGDEI